MRKKTPPRKSAVKRLPAGKLAKGSRRLVAAAAAKTVRRSRKAAKPGLPGPRLDDEQKDLLLLLLIAGVRQSGIQRYFDAVGWKRLASSTISHYRKLWARELKAARESRTEMALTTGLALKAERVAALKEHAELMGELRFVPDPKSGRLWNERAWRQALEDIAVEMGDRKPRDNANAEQTIKVYVGLDPDKI